MSFSRRRLALRKEPRTSVLLGNTCQRGKKTSRRFRNLRMRTPRDAPPRSERLDEDFIMSLYLCTAAGICGEERSVEELLLKHAARGNLLRLVATLNREDCPRQFVNSVRNDEGRTALHLAALGGHKECLKVLLRRRANPNMCDIPLLPPKSIDCYP